MKLSNYYFTPGVRTVSAFVGILTGVPSMILFGWQYGLLAGCSMALLIALVLPLLLYRGDLPYERIKETLSKPFLFDERVRFTLRGGRTVGGFFVLTGNSMVFLSVEKEKHRLELMRADVKKVVLEENYSISIFLNDTQFIRVISGVCEEMYGILRENGWN